MAVIYKFSSGATAGLFAFAGDQAGTLLPGKHAPWVRSGMVRPGQTIPHKLDRDVIERAIDDHGYQMWRMKKQPA